MTDATLGASGLWLGTRTGAGGTATLTKSFFGHSPWLHGEQDLFILEYFPSLQNEACLSEWKCDCEKGLFKKNKRSTLKIKVN